MSIDPAYSVRISNDYPTRAVILAAGRGKRLAPFTSKTPKALLRVRGQPMLDTILRALAIARVHNVCIIVNHLAEQIQTYVSGGNRWNLSVEYVRQRRLHGTADALRSASRFISEPFFVLASDYFLRKTQLLELKSAYHQGSADIIVSLKNFPGEEALQRSVVQLDAAGRVRRIIEKPQDLHRGSTTGASLIYILPPSVCEYLLNAPLSRTGEYDLPAVVDEMIKNGYSAQGVLQDAPLEWKP